jgi:hypothetical protein
MPEWTEWLEGTGIAAIARESLYGFQILVAFHIVGLIFSVGSLLWVDLRMLGWSLAGQSLSAVYRSLSRYFLVGFTAMVISGAALFAGFATSAYGNAWFRVKMLAMALAGVNAIVFHILVRRMPEPAELAAPSLQIRVAGTLSILCWGVVILCGRMMSYTLF